MGTKYYIYDKETGLVAMIADEVGNEFDSDKFDIVANDDSIIEEAEESGAALVYDSDSDSIVTSE